MEQAQQYYQYGRRQIYQEMRQKPVSRDTFFSLKSESRGMRPTSVATEFVDTDWDEDDIISEPEDNSPRISLQSTSQPSFTTISTYDEVPTPRTSRHGHLPFLQGKSVEGPRGPHLFHDDMSREEDIILTMSPITPKVPSLLSSSSWARSIPEPFHRTLPVPTPREGPFQYTNQPLDTATLATWTPEMVAQSMLDAGIELSMADRFIENDINGAILITLKFEDLRELDISSFGIRTRVWHQIQSLRDGNAAGPTSPQPPTPIEDEPSREARREVSSGEDDDANGTAGLRRRETNRSHQPRKKPSVADTIMPGESVSIIGIEQVVPKPHVCSKGENCSKYRKQARLIEKFKRLNPNIDVDMHAGATIIVADAGNPQTARSINPDRESALRPMSDAVPSVVASSDVMGTNGMPPLQYLREATLRNLRGDAACDPQDNVRQFLQFQQSAENEVPPTPPFEVGPSASSPHHAHALRRLPRLSIPTAPPPMRYQPPRAATVPPQMQMHHHHHQHRLQQQQQVMIQPQQELIESPQEFMPYQMDKANPLSPDLETVRNPFRGGTPFSEMDVPVTVTSVGPVARDASQSVPPGMNFRHHVNGTAPLARTQSRASARRPSFPVMPVLDENRAIRMAPPKTQSPDMSPPPRAASARPSLQQQQQQQQQQPLHAPPRVNYPWSPVERSDADQALPLAATLPPVNADAASSSVSSSSTAVTTTAAANGVTFQGPMKKRKTKILRHEWQDGYFTLKGTRLNMHKDAARVDRTLEYVDIDDYAIACSSVASTSKLSAALKAVSLSSSHSREKSDPVGAFQFQLVPQDKNGSRLRKRESTLPGGSGAGAPPSEGVNGTGKTHHFAVKGRDERIDWMRELMLAKALKQKGDGFEVSVNGSMI